MVVAEAVVAAVDMVEAAEVVVVTEVSINNLYFGFLIICFIFFASVC